MSLTHWDPGNPLKVMAKQFVALGYLGYFFDSRSFRRRLRNSADHCGGWWCQWYSYAPRGRSGPVTCFDLGSHQKYTGWLVNKQKGTDTLSKNSCVKKCLKIEDGSMIPSAFHVSWMLGSTWFDQQSGRDWEVRTCQRLRTHDAELMLAQGTSNMTRENVRVSDVQCLYPQGI